MTNEYDSKKDMNKSYKPITPDPEFIAEAEKILADPNTKWVPLEDVIAGLDSPN
ncbi:MAG: hypothetical protein PHH54_04700 [Candidatus Nanoarchaeia archaeon]|nr:hypothetical protein [Candidatus Nanoarchaeia archaeon]MDD5741256.1 hypothetical protein [Candidatus Nanoarchaeia archaeon]